MQREMFSAQGKQLLDFYTEMSREGYIRQSGEEITNAFSDFELRKFRAVAKTFFEKLKLQLFSLRGVALTGTYLALIQRAD